MSHEAPAGWRSVRLGEVAHEDRSRNADGKIPGERLVGVFKNEGMIPMRERVKGASVDRCKIVQPGAFAYNPMRINIGSIARSAFDHAVMVSPDYVVFSANKDVLDGSFLEHLRRSSEWDAYVGNAGDGGVRIRIYFDHLAEFRFALPPLHEQRRIAEILSSVDEAIAATRAVIEQTEIVKNSAVLDLVQGKHVPGERKPTTGWRIGNFGVSTIPATWKIVHLTSVAKLESGHTPSKKVPEYWDGTINWLSLHDTKNLGKRVIFHTEQKTTQLGIDNSSARLLPAGTVCLSRTASIGHCVILGTEMATSQDFANYVCGKEISNVFLMFLFRGMGDIWNQLSSGSTHKTIYMPIFEQLQIILPPLSVQAEIVQAVSSIYDQIDVLKRELAMLEATKSALMSDLLTGRKRATDALPMAAE